MLAAVVLLVVATVVPSIGAAIASPAAPTAAGTVAGGPAVGGSTTEGTTAVAAQAVPYPLNETNDSDGETLPTVEAPTTETATPPGEGDGPPADVPGANRTTGDGVEGNRLSDDASNRGPPPGVPANGATPPGPADGPFPNETPGSDPGRVPDTGGLANEGRGATDAGPSANRSGPPNGTAPPGQHRRADRERVNVTVENATANETVSVNVSRADAQDGVSFSSIDVTPTRNASFALNVTASEEPIAGKTPSADLSNGTRPLAYLSVDHTIADENVSNVTFTFRVRRDRVNASERNDVAIYRFHGGSWNELPTTPVETTETHYVYRVRSPGLSEFAAGKQTAQFEITNTSVEVDTLSVGDDLTVRVRIANRGEADGTFRAELVLGDAPVAHRHLTIAAGGMRQATFERTVERPGTYEVWVNDVRVGEVTVNGTATTDGVSTGAVSTDDADRDGSTPGGTDADSDGHGTNANVPGLGFGVAIGTLLGGLLAARRRWR